MKKDIKEWNIDTPWGNLAMLSWGTSSNPPVLLVHGYMDTAATFSFIVDKLTDDFFYVAFDMPGHGKSDQFPPGPHVSQAHMVDVVRRIVEHMQWKTFVLVAHSFGVLIGCIYNLLYPGVISRMVWMDPGPGLKPYYDLYYTPQVWYQRYHSYYEKYYGKSASENQKLYKYDDIVAMIAKNRKLNKLQAETVLSRSLMPVGDELYRLSWEPRVKIMATLAISEDILVYLKLKNAIPILLITCSEDSHPKEIQRFGSKIVDECRKMKNCSIITLTGHHDVHITSPDEMAGFINDLLKMEHCAKSKL